MSNPTPELKEGTTWSAADERMLREILANPDDYPTSTPIIRELLRLRSENERLRPNEAQSRRFAEMLADFQQACEEAIGYSPTGETSANPKDCATLRDQLRSRLLALVEIGDRSLAKFIELQSDRHYLREELTSLRSSLAAKDEEIGKLREDVARLDWMESFVRDLDAKAELFFAGLGVGGIAQAFQCEIAPCSAEGSVAWRSYQGASLRDAIDAAGRADLESLLARLGRSPEKTDA